MPVETGYTSLGSLLADMQDLVPTGLIGESGWERVQALTTRLPACAADARFGFEFDLFDPNTTADFCLLLMPGSRITALYEGHTAATAPLLVGPGFRNFLRSQTRDAQSLLSRTGAGIILEYDLAQTLPGQHGPPGVFMATSGSIDGRKARLDSDPAQLVAALESAAGWEPGAIDLADVERERTAAAGAFVAQAGVMPGRGGPAVRLILQGITTDELEETLKRLKWSGDSSLAAACLSDLSEFIALRAALSLDVSSRGVSPRLGMEMFRPTEWYRTAPLGWKSLIERPMGYGWCHSARADALAEWPRIETFFGRDGVYRVRQLLNHVKLVFHRENVSVKGSAAMNVRRTTGKWSPTK